MAENKKSFLLYCDLLEVAKELDDKSRGELFLYILEYVNDLNPEPPNELIKMLFIPIKQQLKRDLKKYENICYRNKTNGSKGGRPKKPKKPSGLTGNPKKPKKPDTDIDTDTVNDIESVRNLLNAPTEWKSLTQKNNKIGDKEFKRLIEKFLPNLKESNKDPEQKRHFTQWLKFQDWKKQEEIVPHWNENRDK